MRKVLEEADIGDPVIPFDEEGEVCTEEWSEMAIKQFEELDLVSIVLRHSWYVMKLIGCSYRSPRG